MNTIQSRFSSVEALRNSDVDVHALKAHGQIEVNGKQYNIRAAADGKISVERPEKQAAVDKFFSGTAHLLGAQSQRSQIAQTLNEKAAANPVAPRLDRLNGKRFDFQQVRVEQGQSSSAASAVKPGVEGSQDKKVFASLHDWAKKAKKLHSPTQQDVYDIFKESKPKVTPMNHAEQNAYLQRLLKINAKEGISVWPQSMDELNKESRFLAPYIAEHYNARKELYRIVPEPSREATGDQGRLTIGVEPKYASQLIRAIADLIRKDESVLAGKVAGPERFGTRTDSAILYVQGDYQHAQELGQKLKNISGLPPEAFISHTPAGMQAIDKGLSYSEKVPGQSSSHGDSRTEVILDALSRKGGSLETRLKEALADKGYNPENPALRRTS